MKNSLMIIENCLIIMKSNLLIGKHSLMIMKKSLIILKKSRVPLPGDESAKDQRALEDMTLYQVTLIIMINMSSNSNNNRYAK